MLPRIPRSNRNHPRTNRDTPELRGYVEGRNAPTMHDTAQLSSKEEDCNELFESYRNCFLKVIAKDMEKRGVKVNETSMIGEYKEETAEEN